MPVMMLSVRIPSRDGAGESALGTRVDVRRLAATLAGRRVTGEAKVINVDRRRIEFSIRAIDGSEEIGVAHTNAW